MRMTPCGMNDKVFLLIDNDHLVIFEDNIDRNIFGYDLAYLARRQYKIYLVTGIEFMDSRKRNYWANSGAYSVDGSIQPGIDHPLDFNKKPLPINGGEVFHPFDKRPR